MARESSKISQEPEAEQGRREGVGEKCSMLKRVQKGIANWDKQNNDVPAPNCMLKVQGEIIKVEGL